MKRTLVCIGLLLSSMTLCLSQNCRYEKYYYWCNLALLSDSHIEAARYYKIAFGKTDFCLGTDLSSALQVALAVNDSIWAEDLCIKLAKGGVGLEYFHSLSSFSWYSHFVDSFPLFRDHYVNYYDHTLRAKFLDLQLRDSIWNQTYHSWCAGEIELTLDQLISNSTAIRDSLYSLIVNHGFPNEQNMGYYYTGNAVKPYPIVPLLIHIYQRGDLLYRDRLSAISCDGKLRPMEVAVINKFTGFGDSSGIEQEMKIRWNRCRPDK